MNINSQTLPYKTEAELLNMLLVEGKMVKEAFLDNDEDLKYQALENIEQIIYALRNYELEA